MRLTLIARSLFLVSFVSTLGCQSAPKLRAATETSHAPLVLTTDFGLRDGAVSAMRGVAYGVAPDLNVSDLTHEIPPFDIWQAALRLQQVYRYWPAGTVFATIVDPGVGSARRSIVVRTKSGHYFVGPDNGHLTMVIDEAGIDAVRVIDEATARRPTPEAEVSYTFHGRDLYVYVAAQLAAGRLKFEQTGALSSAPLQRLTMRPAIAKSGVIYGGVPVLDVNYGNVWTNVPKSLLTTTFPNARELRVYLAHRGQKIFEGTLPIGTTFAAVPRNQPVIYVNSLLNLAIATNQGNFAELHRVGAGPDWTIVFSKP